MAERVFIPVGAPTSGMTFVQGVVWRNRELLRRAGVRPLGDSQSEIYAAGRALHDTPQSASDPGPDGTEAWGTAPTRASTGWLRRRTRDKPALARGA